MTTHAARRDGNTIIHVASGMTHIGPTSSVIIDDNHLADTLHQALPDVAWHNDISAACWQKLAVNCVINPLTGLYNCRNGDVQRYPELIERLCAEVASVMEMEGITPPPKVCSAMSTMLSGALPIIPHHCYRIYVANGIPKSTI